MRQKGLLVLPWQYLEDVEALELDVATFLAQHVHHQLQVVRVADVARHDCEVVSIKQKLP